MLKFFARKTIGTAFAFGLLLLIGCSAADNRGSLYFVEGPYEPAIEDSDSDPEVDLKLTLTTELPIRSDSARIGFRPKSPFPSHLILHSSLMDWLHTGLQEEFQRAGIEISNDAERFEARLQMIYLWGTQCRSGGNCLQAIAAFDVELIDQEFEEVYRRKFVADLSEEVSPMTDEALEKLIRDAVADVFSQIVNETHSVTTAGL